MNSFWDGLQALDSSSLIVLILALLIGFGFEVINGFHDTANAVTTVIYTRTLKATPAVIYSGFMNFLGVMVGGTAIAFSIVNLLPVDLLINATSSEALVMVMALLIAGVTWNLGTWAMGLPVSSSHTLIGSILGVGMAHSLLSGSGLLGGVNWHKAGEVGLALLASPLLGFGLAAVLLLAMKAILRDPVLYTPQDPSHRPPWWVRIVLIGTCGGVSMAHGTNDGQKGMGLILLVLVGLMPQIYGLKLDDPDAAYAVRSVARQVGESDELLDALPPERRDLVRQQAATIERELDGVQSLSALPADRRWEVRTAIVRLQAAVREMAKSPGSPWKQPSKELAKAVEYVPGWVVLGVATCLGVGTTIGYKRIVVTVAEKIGKTHLTYGQGAAAEIVAAGTIGLASITGLPVSTTHVLSSGIAGTMWANRSGIQQATIAKIALAWLLTLPASMALAAILFFIGHWLF